MLNMIFNFRKTYVIIDPYICIKNTIKKKGSKIILMYELIMNKFCKRNFRQRYIILKFGICTINTLFR
uniref:Uncharacterized protein n=1 Tax=Siphoviridae sp. ctiOl67 TaxID=2825622 RepID=A0A8S5QIU3_9CAUD|nr:MAG TPA: hypothetical protein [Siphoviridae sp. ctiOl67]